MITVKRHLTRSLVQYKHFPTFLGLFISQRLTFCNHSFIIEHRCIWMRANDIGYNCGLSLTDCFAITIPKARNFTVNMKNFVLSLKVKKKMIV